MSLVINLKIPAMFNPVWAFLIGGSELAWVWGVYAFGDEAFKDLGVPELVACLKCLPYFGKPFVFAVRGE